MTRHIVAEEWRKVTVHGDYSVSSSGSVRRDVGGKLGAIAGKILKQKMRNGYKSVTFYFDRKPKMFSVHRLVALAFIENTYSLLEVNHRDGDKNNNHASNLEWTTRSGNTVHAYSSGLMNPPSGDNHYSKKHPTKVPKGSMRGGAKLSEDDVSSIRRQLNYGIPQRTIAYRFSISQSTIWRIKSGKGWCHV